MERNVGGVEYRLAISTENIVRDTLTRKDRVQSYPIDRDQGGDDGAMMISWMISSGARHSGLGRGGVVVWQYLSDLGALAQLLNATLDASRQRAAEASLKTEAAKPGYSLQLLNIVASTPLPLQTRLAAALAFKNFIRSNYVDEEGAHLLPETDTLKSQLIGLMISTPPALQSQLGEAISLIADSDFWERWDTLTTDLVQRFSQSDPKVNLGVLEVAHSIFSRWRPLFRTNELYHEINHVIDTFGQPFVSLLITTHQQIQNLTAAQLPSKGSPEKADVETLTAWIQTMSLLVKILHDMSSHDLPPIFEENLSDIAGLLEAYLVYTNPLLDTDDDTTPSVITLLQADVCDLIQVWTLKYDDDFSSYCGPFIQTAWNLVSTVNADLKYDVLVSKALHFLTAVASTRQHSENFNNESVLSQIVEKVVLPNMVLRETDMEMFEDEPIEFIRRDLEGSDAETRRRAATDFLGKLLERFESLVTSVVSRYINVYLEQGQTSWQAKDTAVYLFMAIAAKGAVTAAQGVKTVNPNLDVVDFFQKHIASDLTGKDAEPIAQVDAIKYLHTFRSQLSKDQWLAALPHLIQSVGSENYIVYTYAAIAIERLLYLTNDAGEHVVGRADVEGFAHDLIQHLLKLIEKDASSSAKLQENEFLMRCLMRILIVVKDGAAPICENVVEHLVAITEIMKQNPSNPRFYYYHFESLGALVRYCGATQAAVFNDKLWRPINQILAEDVTEFVPYLFQILAQLLESSPAHAISQNYMSLLDLLLLPAAWESRGNVPACVRLLSALLPRTADDIIANGKLTPVMGVFQMLLNRKKLDVYGFDILEAVVSAFPPSATAPLFGTILQLLLGKLQAKPSDSFQLRFVRFFHLVSARLEAGYGVDFFIQQADQLQEGVFKQIYPAIILPETEKLVRPVDRKLAVVSLTKILSDSQAFAEQFAKGWANTCHKLLGLLANAPVVARGQDEMINEADIDNIGFSMTFTPLNTCKPSQVDDFPEITDVGPWVREHMRAANERHGGRLVHFVEQRLAEEPKAALTTLLK